MFSCFIVLTVASCDYCSFLLHHVSHPLPLVSLSSVYLLSPSSCVLCAFLALCSHGFGGGGVGLIKEMAELIGMTKMRKINRSSIRERIILRRNIFDGSELYNEIWTKSFVNHCLLTEPCWIWVELFFNLAETRQQFEMKLSRL